MGSNAHSVLQASISTVCRHRWVKERQSSQTAGNYRIYIDASRPGRLLSGGGVSEPHCLRYHLVKHTDGPAMSGNTLCRDLGSKTCSNQWRAGQDHQSGKSARHKWIQVLIKVGYISSWATATVSEH